MVQRTVPGKIMQMPKQPKGLLGRRAPAYLWIVKPGGGSESQWQGYGKGVVHPKKIPNSCMNFYLHCLTFPNPRHIILTMPSSAVFWLHGTQLNRLWHMFARELNELKKVKTWPLDLSANTGVGKQFLTPFCVWRSFSRAAASELKGIFTMRRT